jgi:ribonuclease HII
VGSNRPRNPLEYEERFWGRGFSRVVGVDEAGRGPLAGPVIAAAVLLPEGCRVKGAADSKALSRIVRERLFPEIRRSALAVGIGAASVREIDALNILQATSLAMDRALRALRISPDHVVVDGLPVPNVSWAHEAIVGGDAKVHSVACASIVAKVIRDQLMRRLARRHPAYGWDRNMGYGTAEHLQILREEGPTPHHRRSFRGTQLDLLGP